MARFRGLLIGLCIVSLVLSGCGTLFSTPEPVTLSFVCTQGTTPADYEVWVQEFQEEHPQITIELKQSEGMASGAIAEEDTFMATQFELQGLLQAQSILPLSPFVEQAEDLATDDFYPGTLQVFGSQGQLWALPYGVDLLMMYYNKDIFDRYGAPYPQPGWTWLDFTDLALRVTDVDAGQFGYALQYNNEFAIYEPVVFIYQHGGAIFDDLQNPTRATLNDPLNVEALEWYVSLIHDLHVAPTRLEGPAKLRFYPWQGVMEQKYAMWTMMFSNRGMAFGRGDAPEAQMNWGVVPLPGDRSAVTLGLATGLFISAGTTHPDEAWLWIEFLSKKIPLYQIPSRESIVASKAYEDQVGLEAATAARAALEQAVLVNPSLLGFETALSALETALQTIRDGEAPPQEALDAAQDRSGF